MYVIFVDATSANGLFEQGLNAILVSRPTLLNSKLNTSIFNFNPSSPGEMEDFKDATFYAYDNSKASQKGALVGAVTVTLSGDKATKLLNEFILINASGGKIAEARKLTTAQVHQLGIHPDIMSLVAQQGFEMSDTGDLPKTLAGAIWEGLTGLVAGVADVLYQGLVAIGNFFASLGDAVANWGQKLLGGLSKATDAVKAAVQAVLDAINAIVQWIITKVGEMLNAAFAPLINTIQNIADELYAIIDAAYQNYLIDGTLGTAQENALANWILTRIILPAIIIAVVITAISYLFAPFATLGALIALGVTGILIAHWASDKQIHPRPLDISTISPLKTFQQNFLDFYNSLVPSTGNREGRGSRQQQTPAWVFLLLNIFTATGLVLSAIGAYITGSMFLVGLATMFAVIIILLGIFTYLVPPNDPVAVGFNNFIAYLSIFAFILCVIDLISIVSLGPDDVGFENKGLAAIFALMGVMISGISLFIAGDTVGWW